MGFTYSKKSKDIISTCSPSIQEVMYQLINIMDVSALSGYRGEDEQNALVAAKASKLKYPGSYHNRLPSEAIDVVPYHKKYKRLNGSHSQIKKIMIHEDMTESQANGFVREQFTLMAGMILAIAYSNGTPMVWGGDWDNDNDLSDNKFDDLAHFQRRI